MVLVTFILRFHYCRTSTAFCKPDLAPQHPNLRHRHKTSTDHVQGHKSQIPRFDRLLKAHRLRYRISLDISALACRA